MVSLKTRSFPVVGNEGQLLGIISREDVMRALKRRHGKIDAAASPLCQKLRKAFENHSNATRLLTINR
jgi:predicted transcriptional regulator